MIIICAIVIFFLIIFAVIGVFFIIFFGKFVIAVVLGVLVVSLIRLLLEPIHDAIV